MIKKLLLLLPLIFLNSCNINWYGDIDLGSNFYYLVDPAFNSVVIPVNPREPYKSSIFVIKDVESIGFDNNTILVTSITQEGKKYWLIDKTQKSKKLGYADDSVMNLSNISGIDSINFNITLESTSLKMKTKTQYRKELNYE